MLTLHHAPQSRSSRIIWLLEELGAKYEIKITSIPRLDGTGSSDPSNPHPDKKVPALVHDGTLVTESIAIMQYLTDLYPEAGMAPKLGDPGRGAYLTWLAYYAGVMEPVINLGFNGLGDHAGLQRTFGSRAAMDRRLTDALKAHPYILGDGFSAVDLLVASTGLWARQMLPAGELVDDYLSHCSNRPAGARALGKDRG